MPACRRTLVAAAARSTSRSPSARNGRAARGGTLSTSCATTTARHRATPGSAAPVGPRCIVDSARAASTWSSRGRRRELERDSTAYTELRDACAAHGVRWAYSGTVYDLADRSDRFRTGLDALVAEDEAERTRERVLRAMRANAAEGRPHGRLPFGYRRIYDPVTRELVRQEQDPDGAACARGRTRRFLAGESARSIANDWNGRGITTPHGDSTWNLTQIRRILTNPAMAGLRVHKGGTAHRRGHVGGSGDPRRRHVRPAQGPLR